MSFKMINYIFKKIIFNIIMSSEDFTIKKMTCNIIKQI